MKLKTLLLLFIALSTNVIQAQVNIYETLVSNKHVHFDADKMYFRSDSDTSEFSDIHFYDRFGDPIPLSTIKRTDSQPNVQGHGRPNTKAGEVSAGHFVLHYAEETTGFNQTGSEGDERRAVLEQVCRDISALIATPPNDPCTGQPAKVHLLINSGDPLPANALGGATSAYDTRFGDNMILDSEVWKVLVTGKGSEEKIYHGFIKINFQINFYTNLTPIPYGLPNGIGMQPGRFEEYDLYSVLIHELLHACGFASLIDFDGQSEYKSEINKSFFSRFDRLLSVNGGMALSSSTPNTPYYNLSSNLDGETVTKGCALTRSNPSSCNYLNSSQGIFAPSTYMPGSSFSHYDPTCQDGNGLTHNYIMSYSSSPRSFSRIPDQEEVNLLNEIGYKTTGIYGTDPLLAGNYNTYSSGASGIQIGGVNDDYSCSGDLLYSLETCNGAMLSIPILNNDGNTEPESVVGIRVLGNNGYLPTFDGSNLQYTAPQNGFLGYTYMQYVPIYLDNTKNCEVFGNITEVVVFNYPCGDSYCYDESPNCMVNCNGDFYDHSLPDGSYTILQDGKIKFWTPLDKGDPDFHVTNGKGDYGFWRDEPLLHAVNLIKDNQYHLAVDFKTGGELFEEIRIIAVNDPLIRNKFKNLDVGLNSKTLEQYLTELNIPWELAMSVSESNLDLNSNYNFETCYKPNLNVTGFVIYLFDQNMATSDYTILNSFEIKQLNLAEIEDQFLSCTTPNLSINVNNNCGLDNILDFNWKFNDQYFGFGLSTDNITEPGTYTLVGFNKGNGEVCYTDEFEVFSEASFTITGTVNNVQCNPEILGSIDVSVNGSNPNAVYTYEWDDEVTTEDRSDLTAGTHTVTVSNSNNCFLSKSFTVGKPGVTSVQLSSNDSLLCGPETATISATPSYQFLWLRNGQTINSQLSNSINVTEGGTYEIQQGQCYSSAPITIEKIEIPLIEANHQAKICPNSSVTLSIQNVQNVSVQWYRNNIVISGATQNQYDAVEEGNYSVIISRSGCSLTSNAIDVTKIYAPVISCTGSTKICDNYKPILHVDNYSTNIQWYNSAGAISGATSIDYTATVAGTYYATYTNGVCTVNSNSITITKPASPTISANGPTTFCADKSVTLTTPSVIFGTFQWVKNSEEIAGATTENVSVNESGAYQVVYSPQPGCDLASNSITVTAKPLPIAYAGEDKIYCTTVVLGGTLPPDNSRPTASGGNGTYDITWSPNTHAFPFVAAFTNKLANPVVTPVQSPRTYTVKVVSDGCEASDKITVSKASIYDNRIRPGEVPCNLNEPFIIYGSYPNGGGDYTYSWERRVGNQWQSMINGQEKDYRVLIPGCYRRRVSSQLCPTTYTYSDTVCVTQLSNPDNWPATFPSESLSYCDELTIDNSENIVFTGTFKKSVNFKTQQLPYQTIEGSGGFISQYDRCGGEKWVIEVRSQKPIQARILRNDQYINIDLNTPLESCIAVDKVGKVYAAGTITNTASFINKYGNIHPVSLSSGTNYLIRITPNGEIEKVGSLNHGNPTKIFDLAFNDQTNQVFVLGINDQNQGFLSCLTPDFEVLWVKYFENTESGGFGLKVLNNGSLVIKGRTLGGATFDAKPVSSNLAGDFIFNFDPAANAINWNTFIDGQILSSSVSTSSLGLIYLTGTFSGSILNGSLSTTYDFSQFAIQFNSTNGNVIWSKYTDNPTYNNQYNLNCAASNDGLYLTSLQLSNSVMTKLDLSGNLVFENQIAGVLPLTIGAVDNVATPSQSPSVYFSGMYNGEVQFDQSTIVSTSPGGEGFIQHMSSNGVTDIKHSGTGSSTLEKALNQSTLKNTQNHQNNLSIQINSLSLSGKKQPAINSELKISPNPCDQELTLEYRFLENPTFKVLDMSGRTFHLQGNISQGNNKVSFNTRSLIPGTYILVVESGKTVKHLKFQVMR